MKIHKINKFPKRLVKKTRKTSKRTKKFDGREAVDRMNRKQLIAYDMATNPTKRAKTLKRQLPKMPYSEEILEKNSYRGDQIGEYWRKDYEKQT